ncbi:MAG: glycosyl transferase, partial [Alphaproteobacteria bacterium]|nr:glycosyl transferase [Alphaproteobacteria bacterium]
SSGGAAVGGHLLETALAAQALLEPGRRWRLLLGADLPGDVRERLLGRRGPLTIVEAARSDFPGLLRRCHVSLSQAGYNTLMDIMQAKARAVLVPFATDSETEQSRRAAAFAARGWATVVEEAQLDARRLAAAVNEAASRPRPDTTALRCDGIAETVRLIETLRPERAA